MELANRLIYTLIGTASFLYFIVKVALGYWKRRGILHEKPKKPWGHLKGVGRKKHVSEVLQSLYDKYKGQAPFIGFYAWLKPMLLILDIDTINYILNKDSKYFMNRGLYYNTNDDPLSKNLLQMDGIEWQHLHLKVRALQWPEKLTNIFAALLKVQQTYEKSLEDIFKEKEFIYNITELVEDFNLDIISSLVFGLEGDSLRYKDTQFRKMCKNYTQPNNNIYKIYLSMCFPFLARLLQYRMYSLEATNYFQKLINDKLYEREYQHSQQTSSYDFLQIWCDSRKIGQRNQTLNKLDNREIAAQAFNFISAGLDAATTTVTCCLYELALHPEVQTKARDEINKVLAEYENKITLEVLEELVYLNQILNETLRKHSPYPLLLRQTTKDYELPNSIFMFRKGNHLIIPTIAIHNDAAYYEHPEKFYPDHFHSTKVQNRPKCAFLPYGLGPRSCSTQNFTNQQMLVLLVTLLKRFTFTPCQETVIPLAYDNIKILRQPKKDIKLMIKRL